MNHWKCQLKKYNSTYTEMGYINRVGKKYKSGNKENRKTKGKE